MKRILSTLTLLLCFAFTAVNAQVITAERAAEIANSFFSAGMQKSAAARGVVASSSLTTSFDSNDVVDTTSAEPTFYVLTNPEGGFVIVSGEETENPIIGYSFDGTIDTSNLPDGFVDYMTDIDAQVRALREYNAVNPQKSAAARSAMARTNYATSMGNIVRNLQVAKFHQDAPFNNLCKTANGSAASAGCVPIAYAMLCNYYNWPVSATGKGVHSATGETITFGHEYDWDNILDDYSGTYTTAQADAVATLVRDLGYAYQVSYGTGGTGSELKGEGAAILIEQFGFKSLSTTHVSQTYATTRDVMADDDRWKGLIKDCLDKNYPIPYSAYNTSTKGRHIFMLDGYTDNDYYHFNWGWGDGNGWFTLDNMVPSTNKTYTSQHYAYFYLIPNKTEYAVKVTVGEGEGTVSINNGTPGTTATASLFNGVTATLTAYPAEGYALASWTKNGVVVGSKNTLQVPVGTSDNDYVANFAEASTVTVIQDYTINATSGTTLTTDKKIKEWAFNANNDYPAALKLTSTTESINTNNAGDCIQLYLVDKTSETFTLSVPEDYVITKYTIRCKTSSTYITSIAAEGQTYTPTKSYADYTFTKNAQARGAANSSELTIVGSANRALMVEAITVTVAKEGADVPSTPTTYTINVNAETGGNAYVNGTNTSATVDAGTDVTLQAYPDGTNYTFAGWYNGNSWVSSNNPYTFALNSNVTYTAKFNAVATTYNITAEASPQNAGKVAINGGTQSTVANIDATSGSTVSLQAYPNSGYEFAGWYNGTTKVSSDNPYSITATAAISYIASFQEVQQGGSSSTNLAGKYFRLKEKTTGTYMNIYDNNTHGKETRGGVNVTTLNKNNDGQIFQFIESGTNYELQSKTGYYITWAEWNVNADSDTNGAVLIFESTANNLEYLISCTKGYFKIDDDKGTPSLGKFVYCDAASTAAATWVLEEVVYYTVTATAGEGGSVSPLTSTIEKDKPVTLTATADEGYRFVNWTLNGNVVSTNASYTVTNVTANAEYVAVFEEIEEVEAGTYYRIAYNFEVPVVAKSAATRAAGDVQTYVVSPSTGTNNGNTKISSWEYTKNGEYQADLKLTAKCSEGPVNSIVSNNSNGYFDLYVQNTADNYTTTFTLSVTDENYKIIGYSMVYKVSTGNRVIIRNEQGYEEQPTSTSSVNTMNVEGLYTNATTFTLATTNSRTGMGIYISSFTVTIQPVGGETPEPETETVKYYVQSEACGSAVGTNLTNALKMTTVNNNASSIFYYAGNKLMSYSTGTFVNENGDTRGLQGIGVEGGNVTINIIDEEKGIATIAAPSYLHAAVNDGTTKTYYVYHCGSDNGDKEHNFVLEEVTSLPVTISSVGYASFYAPVAVIVPEGLEAYYLLEENIKGPKGDRYASMSKIECGVIPANEGVILTGKYGEKADEKTYDFIITTIEDGMKEVKDETDFVKLFNILEGTVATEYVAKDAYVLSKPDGKEIGFYLAEMNKQNDTAFQNNSHKAYLQLPAGVALSAGFRFSFGGTTTVEDVEIENEKEEIYDLTGRKLDGISGAGIYIINGKKVLIK